MLNYVNEFLFGGEILEKTLVKNKHLAYGIIVAYLVFVKWAGPALMKNRKPFELKYAMILYDFGQAFANAYLTYNIIKNGWESWHLHCKLQERVVELPQIAEKLLRYGWLIYLVKYLDLIDTCMFVLRKRDRQVSFLHVFHHCIMCVFCCWFIGQIKTVGYYVVFGLGLNTSVHVVLYFYYGVAAIGPNMVKYLWWKRYLTQFQIAQFFLILAYLSYGFYTGCERMGVKEITFFVYTFIILLLFMDFFKKINIKRKS
ncbi:hypothetical protein JTE90_029619 [Oedothorax gibbosus]|uniref:Elongation of very long chain fatty acids protein n=1 Tax=Oedothorax gibbosus TaxID=931172 RepID=A0AAV6VG99_9ARAC|nr:hypothetical protein JTE90_029619 [Oedothorax gibbosus]